MTTADLGLVRGPAGKDGAAGKAATVRVGTVMAGSVPSVTNSGTGTDAVLNFVLPENTDADTVDGKHASEFATAEQGKKADGALSKADAWQISRKELASGTVLADLPVGRYVSHYSANTFPDLPTGAEGSFILDVESIQDWNNIYNQHSLTDINGKKFWRRKSGDSWVAWVGPNYSNRAGEIMAGHNQYGGNDYPVRMGYVDNLGEVAAIYFLLGNDIYNAPVYRALHADKADNAVALGGMPIYASTSGTPYWYLAYAGSGNKDGTMSIYHAVNSSGCADPFFVISKNSSTYGGMFIGTYRTNGNIGLGLYNDSATMYLTTITDLHVGYVNNSGGLSYMGVQASSFTNKSSRRYKENIRPLKKDEARRLLDLEPVQFDYVNHDNGTDRFGLIAEDAYAVQPQGVTLADVDGEEVPDAIDYSAYVPQLIKLCQMQQAQIDALTARVAVLEKK